ncbi:unnamed protein product [Rhizophagus irregularis]|uniref:Uncharacterized protein n=2 Tax=Rhizophagus irregularis TaxID=588596 RepID=A0A2N1N013_9GLOM|nr:hypothetical protein RhiirC2_852352 [Rhizophagus irregularis]CAB4388862.1 unnamed protein product [Rhizophagus irregularis]CAB5387938.1 unnamed protein product [Rhizophagus irregularis]
MSEKTFSFNLTQESPFPIGLISNSPWEFCSFEPLIYIYFNILFVIIAYPLYRIIAGFFNWELNDKTPAKHFSDMLALVRYDFIVFVLGGYAATFNWIMILSFYISIFAYGLLAEVPFTKTSLPRWRYWPIGMWNLFITAFCAVLAMAGFHIYLAIRLMEENKYKERDNIFIAWYLGCLLIPLILMILAYIVKQEQNTRILTRCYLKVIRIFKRNHNYQPLPTNENEPTENQQQQQTEEEEEDSDPKPYHEFASIHPHHWQIFYTLAFFTRFNHPVSQAAGGITLAIYTQGIGAYGPDNYLTERINPIQNVIPAET